MEKRLVAFFSASGTTKAVAKMIASVAHADLFEILPKSLYTGSDLNWMDEKSRTSVEMSDKKFRPEMVNKEINMTDYDEIFLGFPIWWYALPRLLTHFWKNMIFREKRLFYFRHQAAVDLVIQ